MHSRNDVLVCLLVYVYCLFVIGSTVQQLDEVMDDAGVVSFG